MVRPINEVLTELSRDISCYYLKELMLLAPFNVYWRLLMFIGVF